MTIWWVLFSPMKQGLRQQLKDSDAEKLLKREQPQDAAEVTEFKNFKAEHLELLARFRALSLEELVDSRMLHRLRVAKALERQRAAIRQTLEEFPALKQKLAARPGIKPGHGPKPGDTGPKISI